MQKLDEMAEQAFDDQCTGSNPRYPLIAELKELYRKAYYGEPLAALSSGKQSGRASGEPVKSLSDAKAGSRA